MSFPTKWDQVFLVYSGPNPHRDWIVQDKRTGRIIASCGSPEHAEKIAEKRFEELKEQVEKILLGQ